MAGTFTYTRKVSDLCNTDVVSAGSAVNVIGGPSSTFTSCGSFTVAMYDLTTATNRANGATWCADLGSGWRLPTYLEARSCFCSHHNALGMRRAIYWTSSSVDSAESEGAGWPYYFNVYASWVEPYGCGERFSAPCSTDNADPAVCSMLVRCVKDKN